MRIGELARRTGVSPRALRHYEQHGLLRSEREGNGYRDYPEQAVVAVTNIQRLLASGLLIKEIQQLGDCVFERDLATEPACAAVIDAYIRRRNAVAERLSELHEQHQRLSHALADLHQR